MEETLTEATLAYRKSFEEETGESPFEQPVKYFKFLEKWGLMFVRYDEVCRVKMAVEGKIEVSNN